MRFILSLRIAFYIKHTHKMNENVTTTIQMYACDERQFVERGAGRKFRWNILNIVEWSKYIRKHWSDILKQPWNSYLESYRMFSEWNWWNWLENNVELVRALYRINYFSTLWKHETTILNYFISTNQVKCVSYMQTILVNNL